MKTYVIGFPRIGEKRELKFKLEQYWKKDINFSSVKDTAVEIQKKNIKLQKDKNIDFISINDFSLYDTTLDMIQILGVEPKEYQDVEDKNDRYFAMARGDKTHKALEMTKWFNTNYHYIVPILDNNFENATLDISKIEEEYKLAKEEGVTPKINLIGILTFIHNSKKVDGTKSPFEYFDKILDIYVNLLKKISTLDEKITIQFDEPVFVIEGVEKLLTYVRTAYDRLTAVSDNIDIFVSTYFDHAKEATKVLCSTGIVGIGLDFIYGKENFNILEDVAESGKKLVVGVIDGRNIWASNINLKVKILRKIVDKIDKDNIIISTSCSLLHVPFTTKNETKMDKNIRDWLSFAVEKLDELKLVSKIFFNEKLTEDENAYIQKNKKINNAKRSSSIIHNTNVQKRMQDIDDLKFKRKAYKDRVQYQHKLFQYKPLVTTTIGSFPQTLEVREVRKDFKNNILDKETYTNKMKEFIKDCVEWQDKIGLEVLVHGEFERNDMVEYFGEQLDGIAFSENGWVQSYGSRCVKPPIIYGDVSRKKEMTVSWTSYAQSLTKKPVKGMLTGAVTILNWSFVRDDQDKSETCYQIALAIRDEVKDLEKAGIKIIQVDEAAFKEGFPLRKKKQLKYEKFSVTSFWVSTNNVEDDTQIHTHMCYSAFNDIIKTIEDMDADVISIETSRSGNSLLKIFETTKYKQEIGPGVYDIHSPRIPPVKEIVDQIKSLQEVLPAKQLWINPDCGLKTRDWNQVKQSLENMVEAVNIARKSL